MDLVQPEQPEWRAVLDVEVVLDHFGGPLSRVVVGIQLPGRHRILFSLLFHRHLLLLFQREGRDGERVKSDAAGMGLEPLEDFDPPVSAGWSSASRVGSGPQSGNIHCVEMESKEVEVLRLKYRMKKQNEIKGVWSCL